MITQSQVDAAARKLQNLAKEAMETLREKGAYTEAQFKAVDAAAREHAALQKAMRAQKG